MNFNGRNNQRVIGSMVSSGSSRVCRVTVGRSREEDIYVWDTGGEARSLAKRLENIRNLHANQRCIHVTIVYVTRKLIRFMGISPVSSEIEESRCLGHENHSFILLSNFITQQIKRNQSEKQKIRSMIKFYSRKRIHYIYLICCSHTSRDHEFDHHSTFYWTENKSLLILHRYCSLPLRLDYYTIRKDTK